MHYWKFISLKNNVINKMIDVSFSYCKLFGGSAKKGDLCLVAVIIYFMQTTHIGATK